MFEDVLQREFSEERITRLPRRDELGAGLAFDEVVAPLRMIRELAEVIDRNSDWVESNALSEVAPALNRAVSAMQAIEAFDPLVSDPGRVRTDYIQQVIGALEPLKRVGVPLFGRDVTRELAGRTANFDAELNKLGIALADAETKSASIDAIYRAAQPKAIAIGGRKLAAFYADQTTNFADRARRFLYLGIGALGVLALVSWNPGELFGPNPWTVDLEGPDATLRLALALGPRVVLGSIAAYVLRFASRQYGSNRHLEAVNSNRSIALETFDLYKEGAEDAGAQAIVLTAVAGAIFRDPETGFIRDSKLKLPMGISIPTD